MIASSSARLLAVSGRPQGCSSTCPSSAKPKIISDHDGSGIKATDDLIVAGAAHQRILAIAAGDGVVTAAARDDIGARAAGNRHVIGSGRAVEVQEIGLCLPCSVDDTDIGRGIQREPDLASADLELLDVGDRGRAKHDVAGISAGDRQDINLARSGAAIDLVGRIQRGTDRDEVRTGSAIDDIVARTSDDLVRPDPAVDRVVPRAAIKIVVAVFAVDDVVVVTPVDGVVAGTCVDRVVPAEARDRVGIDCAVERVREIVTNDVSHQISPALPARIGQLY